MKIIGICFITLLVWTSVCFSQILEIEPNNSTSQATALTSGVQLQGSLFDRNDQDYYVAKMHLGCQVCACSIQKLTRIRADILSASASVFAFVFPSCLWLPAFSFAFACFGLRLPLFFLAFAFVVAFVFACVSLCVRFVFARVRQSFSCVFCFCLPLFRLLLLCFCLFFACGHSGASIFNVRVIEVFQEIETLS